MRRFYIETYGCALNRGDSLVIASLLEEAGMVEVDSPVEADVIVINTCTVRGDSEERMRRRIAELAGVAEARGARLVVAGCMAGAQPFTVKRIAPRAVLVSPRGIGRVLEAVLRGVDVLDGPPKRCLLPLKARGSVAELPLVDGCLGSCSFCITKLARPRLDSRDPRAVVEAARRLLEAGVLELRLTGQDLAVYGLDLAGERLLPQLVAEIADLIRELGSPAKIRLGMMSPEQFAEIMDELLPVMRRVEVFWFLHLPVQSGSNRILKLMGRRYTVEEYTEWVREARRRLPAVTVATDIIVGFPGESEGDFEDTLRLVEELRFERVHVAQYTPRPRTPAAAEKQVPDSVKKERSRRLTEVIQRIGLEAHRRLVGSRAVALAVAPAERGGVEARLQDYTQLILPSGSPLGPVEVEVTEATWCDVRGRVLGPANTILNPPRDVGC